MSTAKPKITATRPTARKATKAKKATRTPSATTTSGDADGWTVSFQRLDYGTTVAAVITASTLATCGVSAHASRQPSG